MGLSVNADHTVPKNVGGGEVYSLCGEFAVLIDKISSCCQEDMVRIDFVVSSL